MRQPLVKFIVSITVTVGLGALGGIFTAGEVDTWYTTLQKPSFNPPGWVFGPVWTVLYLLMGISLYLVWKQPASRQRNIGLLMFVLQYLLNFIWSFIFFKQHLIDWALVDIVLLWCLIAITIRLFKSVSRAAAWLLVPYLAWVSFATVLTASILRLNG